MPNTLVILNPIAGNGAGDRTWPLIANALHAGGLAFDLRRTTAPRAAIDLAAAGIRDGYDTLVAVGGDGTVNEVVNGMMQATGGKPAGALAIIPVGSGNDFAKMFAAKPHWRTGVEQILAGRQRRVDIVRVTGDEIAPGVRHPHALFRQCARHGLWCARRPSRAGCPNPERHFAVPGRRRQGIDELLGPISQNADRRPAH